MNDDCTWLLTTLILTIAAFILTGCVAPATQPPLESGKVLCYCVNESIVNVTDFLNPSFQAGARTSWVSSVYYVNTTKDCPARMNMTVAIFTCKPYQDFRR